jgi:translation initiation factor IF-3
MPGLPPLARKPPANRSAPRESFVDKDLGYDRRFTTQDSFIKSGKDRLPIDFEITDPKVMVIDDGPAEGPYAPSFIISKLQPNESLRMLEPYKPANAKEGKKHSYAVCKIVNKVEELKRMRDAKERKKAAGGKVKSKELELSWGIGENDLGTKVRQLSGFLNKGNKVEVAIGRKKGGRQVSKEDAEGLLKTLRRMIGDIEARETRAQEGEVGQNVRLFLAAKGTTP